MVKTTPISLILITVGILTLSGCACCPTPYEGAYSAPETYPEWFNSNNAIVSEEEAYYGYANVMAADSMKAVNGAVQRAKSRLSSNIANRLEAIRNDALIEFGSESRLDQSNFILALSKSDRTIVRVAEANETEAIASDSTGYYGFAKVIIEKQQLVERLDRTFSSYEKAWNSMKESEAFDNF